MSEGAHGWFEIQHFVFGLVYSYINHMRMYYCTLVLYTARDLHNAKGAWRSFKRNYYTISIMVSKYNILKGIGDLLRIAMQLLLIAIALLSWTPVAIFLSAACMRNIWNILCWLCSLLLLQRLRLNVLHGRHPGPGGYICLYRGVQKIKWLTWCHQLNS